MCDDAHAPEPAPAAPELLLRGLLNGGALYFIALHRHWLERPSWAIAVIACGLLALVIILNGGGSAGSYGPYGGAAAFSRSGIDAFNASVSASFLGKVALERNASTHHPSLGNARLIARTTRQVGAAIFALKDDCCK